MQSKARAGRASGRERVNVAKPDEVCLGEWGEE